MLKHKNQRSIEDLLESDDELPSDYEEDPEIPAYLNDQRFDAIKFGWVDSFINYYDPNKDKEQRNLSGLYSSLNEDEVCRKTENLRIGEKITIWNGVLKDQDLYCLKCVEPITSDATMLWFLNFLIYKDLQSNFSFLKTCLVATMHEISPISMVFWNDSKAKKHNFNFVITK